MFSPLKRQSDDPIRSLRRPGGGYSYIALRNLSGMINPHEGIGGMHTPDPYSHRRPSTERRRMWYADIFVAEFIIMNTLHPGWWKKGDTILLDYRLKSAARLIRCRRQKGVNTVEPPLVRTVTASRWDYGWNLVPLD